MSHITNIVAKGKTTYLQELDCDYLVIGAGAAGMAFVDDMLTHGPKSNKFIICDLHEFPGGHWNDAYDFVTLHQPACTYGVSSDDSLGDGTGMTLKNLSSKHEILSYYIKIMKRWVKSGRVQWLPKTKCVWDQSEADIKMELEDLPTETDVHENKDNTKVKKFNIFGTKKTENQNMTNRSMYLVPQLASTLRYHVNIKKKLVDCTYTGTEVPSRVPPRFKVSDKVELVPPNALTKLDVQYKRYVVLGAGKTAIDTIIYLLDNGVVASKLSWVIPSDLWMYPGEFLQKDSLASKMRVWFRVLSKKNLSYDEKMLLLEKKGLAYRFDKNILPKKHHHGTILLEEWDKIQLINDKIRMGRVTEICDDGSMIMTNGIKKFNEDMRDILFVNCTAHGCVQKKIMPVFEDDKNLIRIQPIMTCQILYSAGVIAFIEAFNVCKNDEKKRNFLCTVVPNADTTKEFLDGWYQSIKNELEWAKAHPVLALYTQVTRLNMTNNISFFQKNVVGPILLGDVMRYVKAWGKMHPLEELACGKTEDTEDKEKRLVAEAEAKAKANSDRVQMVQ